MRPNKLEGLPLETLSSQALEFEGKVREQIQLEHLSYGSFLGKLLVYQDGPGVNVIKLFYFVTDDEAQ